MNQHIHAKEIHAWAEGYTIQKLCKLCCDSTDTGHWEDISMPTAPGWYSDTKYRIKPVTTEELYGS